MEPSKAKCTITGNIIDNSQFMSHKKATETECYGIYWPSEYRAEHSFNLEWPEIPMIVEKKLAKILGVKSVIIRCEDQNETGSMKDYLITAAIEDNRRHEQKKFFTVVSSGNHAVSLAHFAQKNNARAIIFVPSSTSKLDLLRSFDNVIVVGVKGAVFEDVYRLANKIDMPYAYNANVSNDFLFTKFSAASKQILEHKEGKEITHFLTGVGNGSYASGLMFGFDHFGNNRIIPVPVGMDGAFPLERALRENVSHIEYEDFLVPENLIDAAEGSIALASYSMPQLTYAIRTHNGFPLGSILNDDIKDAYTLFAEESNCFKKGFVPEPTGIMSLAAALKYKDLFSKDDSLLLSFTGAGYKTMSDLNRCSGIHRRAIMHVAQKDPRFKIKKIYSEIDNFIHVDKTEDPILLSEKIEEMIR